MISSRRNEEFSTTSEQNGVHICRLCGQGKYDVIAIFSEEAHRKHVLLKIQTRLLIQISASDPLPKNACINCLEKLDSLWDFFELCRKTQIKLRETFLKQRRGKQVTITEQTIIHQDSIGTLRPPHCSLKSITHETAQDTLDSALGNKRIKLEHVPFIESLEEELVCLDENRLTVLASTVTSSAGSQEPFQNVNREISIESSKTSDVSVRLDLQQKSDTIAKTVCLSEVVDDTVSRNMLVLQDCDIDEGRSTVPLSVEKSVHLKAMSSQLKDNSLGEQGRLENVFKTKPVIDKQASLDCVNSSAAQENKSSSTSVISLSHGESHDNVLLDRIDSSLSSTKTVSDSEIQRAVPLIGTEKSITRQTGENISTGSFLSCRKNQEALQQMSGNSSVRSSSENNCQAGVLSVNSGASHFQLEKVESNILQSLLCARGKLEKGGRCILQKEDTGTHVRKSVSQERKKCIILEEKDKISASNNTVLDSDTLNSCGKLHGGGGGGGGNSDSNDGVNSFSCHDCGSSFSCKNSLTDHIFKEHLHAGQTNTFYATPPTIVTVKISDSSINQPCSSDIVSVQGANTSDGVLQKPETNRNCVQTQDKPTEDARASNCKVHSVDDNDCVVTYDSTSNKISHVKPLETELKPTTIDEARLLVGKYLERICETSGENPKINMINIKVDLTSGTSYTDSNKGYRKIFKPFIVLNDSRYDCQICKTTLNNRVAIVNHIGKHFNLFPYCCNICDKRYTLHSTANQHIKNHFTRLICEQCGAVCVSSTGYFRHMQRHDKPFSCHDCGKRFCSKPRVRSHILKEHLKIRSYACKICGKAYFHESNVTTHMTFAHADRKIVCQYCGKMYFRNNMLKEHINRWHT